MSEETGNTPPGSDAPQQARSQQDLADELTFGEVQTKTQKSTHLPPTSNGHFAVQAVTCEANKSPSKPPPTSVFVDLDTMLDMQEHAAEDTSVELGGILLGHRGVQPDGSAFVVINDSLRARHYKATRGSFKFTHETWADLNQQRSLLPETTEIVGWYHTHPGWGVFLSDLDVFICDHFFAGPDDVALVIDPTSGDTGLFVRRDTPAKRPPARLSNYHIFAHRKCRDTLLQWANYFSGGQFMSNSNAVFPGRSSSPVIISAPASESSANRLVLLLAAGIIGSQIFLGLVFYVSQQRPEPTQVVQAPDIEAREAVIDQLISSIATEGPQSLGESYRQLAISNLQLKAANLGLMSRVGGLEGRLDESTELARKVMLELEAVRERFSVAQQQLADTQPTANANQPAPVQWWQTNWAAAIAGALIGSIIAGLGTFYGIRRGELTNP